MAFGFFNRLKEDLREIAAAGISKLFDYGTQGEQAEQLRQDIEKSEESFGISAKEEFFKKWEKSYYEGYALRSDKAIIRHELAVRGYYIDGATKEEVENEDYIPKNNLMEVGTVTSEFVQGMAKQAQQDYNTQQDILEQKKSQYQEKIANASTEQLKQMQSKLQSQDGNNWAKRKIDSELYKRRE